MKTIHAWLAGAALLALAPQALAQQKAPAKKLYCWNENGRKICGDALPAAAVDNARVEISASSGLPLREVERAPTEAERAAAEAQAERDRQAARLAEAEARREMAMVESYATEADLRRAYQHRITLLDESVKTSRLSVTGLRQSLLGLLRRAGEAELAGRPVAKPLAVSIQTQHRALLRQQGLLAEQLHERGLADEELAAAVERYRALKAPLAETDAG